MRAAIVIPCYNDQQFLPETIASVRSQEPSEVLVRAGGYQLREGYEDWDLWMALAEQGVRGVHVPQLVERHRETGGRRWSQDFSRHERALTVLRERHRELFAARALNRRRSKA